jgi:hypothetical protein
VDWGEGVTKHHLVCEVLTKTCFPNLLERLSNGRRHKITQSYGPLQSKIDLSFLYHGVCRSFSSKTKLVHGNVGNRMQSDISTEITEIMNTIEASYDSDGRLPVFVREIFKLEDLSFFMF